MNPAITDGAGKGWHEVFLKGSKEAESELITRGFAPEINRIQRDIQRIEGEQYIKRAQHGNMLAGTKNADFLVLTDIPADLRVGLFQPGKHYQAHVRFSSASSIEQPDSTPDLRGAALRVKSDAGNNHDFLMTNAPFSHARDARQFMLVASAAARLGRPAALWRWRTWRTLAAFTRLMRRLGSKEALRVLRTVRKQTSRPVASLATECYWSRSPYAFGPVAVKFKLVPAIGADEREKAETGVEDLRAELISRLRVGDIKFDFSVQRFVNSERTPIEDETVEWVEEVSPSITIARLIIPAQELIEADEMDINIYAFNPWNTSSGDFRPLGSMNRAAELVYYASAKLRNES